MEPREEILFLAQEMTKAPDNADQRIISMKKDLTKSLQNMSLLDGEDIKEDSSNLDERYQKFEIYEI